MYNELLRLVEANYSDLATRAQFFGRLDTAVNVVAWLFQGVVVGWLIRKFEVVGALIAIPILALLSFVTLAVVPTLMVLAGGQIIRRAGEFGIAKPSREVLFTVVDAESKYKAKNFIDTVMQRGSDMVGIWLFFLLQSAGVALAGNALICAVAMVAAIAISLGLGHAFARRQSGTS
jgi:AAA family ATP:ADP antiporter